MGKAGSGGMGMAMMTLGSSMAEVGNGEGKQQRVLGLGMLIGGTVCVLIGLNSGETSCVSDQPSRQSCSND